jgi:hypothetical protein
MFQLFSYTRLAELSPARVAFGGGFYMVYLLERYPVVHLRW